MIVLNNVNLCCTLKRTITSTFDVEFGNYPLTYSFSVVDFLALFHHISLVKKFLTSVSIIWYLREDNFQRAMATLQGPAEGDGGKEKKKGGGKNGGGNTEANSDLFKIVRW